MLIQVTPKDSRLTFFSRKQCLFCAKRFQTVEGVRGHMRDKKHVRLVFEPPAVFRGNPLFDEAIRLANEDGYQVRVVFPKSKDYFPIQD